MPSKFRTIDLFTMRGPAFMAWLTQTVKEKLDSREGIFHDPVYIIAPSSTTHSITQSLMDAQLMHGAFELRVLSPDDFRTLAEEMVGRTRLAPISETGRSMVIGQLLPDLLEKGQLQYFHRAARQTSLPVRLVEELDELEDAGYSPDQLLSASRTTSPATTRKLHDLAGIWDAYTSFITGRFEDENQRWASLMPRLERNRFLSGTHIILCGFDTINLHLTSLLISASGTAASVTLGLITDEQAPDSRIFSATMTSLSALRARLSQAGVRIRQIHFAPAEDSRNPGLQWLEKQLFSPIRPQTVPDLSCVETFFARSSYMECVHVAQRLHAWHRDGIAWDDIRITFCEADTLPSLLPLVLENTGIPVSVHQGLPLLANDYAVYFLSTIRAACLGFLKQDMLRLIRSGCAPLTREESMLLENHAISFGLDRKRWLNPIPVTDRKGRISPDLERLEKLRRRITEPLEALRNQLARRSCSATQAAEAIYHTMVNTGAYDKLLQRGDELQQKGLLLAADQNRQVWDACNDLLTQLSLLIHDRHVSLSDLVAMMESAMTGMFIKSIPQQVHCVQIASPGMLISRPARRMVIMGLQDSRSEGESDLFTPGERRSLSDFIHSPVGMTLQEQNARNLQGIYQALCQATDGLLVTCSAARPDGSIMYPGNIYTTIRELLSKSASTESISEIPLMPVAPSLALEQIALRLRSVRESGGPFLDPLAHSPDGRPNPDTVVWQKAFAGLFHSPAYRPILDQIIRGLTQQRTPPVLSHETATALYLAGSTSISRLEQFASCPYRHFITYGLRPQIRREFMFTPDAEGNFYHSVLQQYMTEVMRHPDWPNLSDAQIQAVLNRILVREKAAWSSGPLNADEAHRYQAMEMVGNVRRTAWEITRSLQQSRFVPNGMEVVFGLAPDEDGQMLKLPGVLLTLSDGTQLTLSGKIDRLDLYTDEGGTTYARVLDYKRSEHNLYDPDLTYGLQLQLPLYLSAVRDGMQNVRPAGGLYQQVCDPLINAPDADTDTITASTLHEMRLSGIMLDLPEIADAMGPAKTRAGHGESAVVRMVSQEEMDRRIEQAREIATRLSEEIRSGIIDVQPVEGSRGAPCTYCLYQAACGFDPRQGDRVKELASR